MTTVTLLQVRTMLDNTWLRQFVIVTAIIGPVIYSIAVNADSFDRPPAWDSAVTVSPAALTIADSNFDIWEVAQLPSSPAGGPSTHATSIYTIALAVLILWLGPANAFFAAHLTSIALVGALTAGTYLLARERASQYFSALAAVTIGVLPMLVQQASDVYLDLPLAATATLACWAAHRRRFWLTATLALVGVAIKTSGVFLLPLILLARPENSPVRRHLVRSAIAGAIASSPFFVVLLTTHRFDSATSVFDLVLIRSSAALLVMTVDVFVMMAVFLLVIYGRARSRNLDRTSQVSLVLVASFVAVHLATVLLSGTIAILPRYYIAVLPAVIVAFLPLEGDVAISVKASRVAPLALIAVLGIFSIVNVRGDFYPLPNHDFYVAAERSTRAQDLLALHVVGTRELVATGIPLLVERQVHFRLEYPGMGYVDSTPEETIPVFIEPIQELPERFAMLIEREYTNPLIPIEEAAIDLGYSLEYEEIAVGPYRSRLVVATR